MTTFQTFNSFFLMLYTIRENVASGYVSDFGKLFLGKCRIGLHGFWINVVWVNGFRVFVLESSHTHQSIMNS